jgi:hypothetical protein
MDLDDFGGDGAFLEDLLPTLYVILPKEQKRSLYFPELNREMYRSVKQVEYLRKN